MLRICLLSPKIIQLKSTKRNLSDTLLLEGCVEPQLKLKTRPAVQERKTFISRVCFDVRHVERGEALKSRATSCRLRAGFHDFFSRLCRRSRKKTKSACFNIQLHHSLNFKSSARAYWFVDEHNQRRSSPATVRN